MLGQGGGEEVGMPFRWLPGTCGKEYGEFYPDHSAWKRLRHEYKQARGTLSTAATFFSTFEKKKKKLNFSGGLSSCNRAGKDEKTADNKNFKTH